LPLVFSEHRHANIAAPTVDRFWHLFSSLRQPWLYRRCDPNLPNIVDGSSHYVDHRFLVDERWQTSSLFTELAAEFDETSLSVTAEADGSARLFPLERQIMRQVLFHEDHHALFARNAEEDSRPRRYVPCLGVVYR
jgi:hypothetical protein